MRQASTNFVVLLAIVACCSLVVGCGEANRGSPASETPGEASGSTLFPDESLEQWVSYADHVVIFSVVRERMMPLDAEEKQLGEGYAARIVTLRIDKTLWSASNAPPLPREIEMEAFGSVYKDGEERPMQSDDGPRVAVGERYLSPLALVEFDVGPEWWPLTPASQLPLTGSRIGTPTWRSPLSQVLAGRTIDDAASQIRTQEPDPLAVKYSHLRPQDRVEAVAQETEPSSR